MKYSHRMNISLSLGKRAWSEVEDIYWSQYSGRTLWNFNVQNYYQKDGWVLWTLTMLSHVWDILTSIHTIRTSSHTHTHHWVIKIFQTNHWLIYINQCQQCSKYRKCFSVMLNYISLPTVQAENGMLQWKSKNEFYLCCWATCRCQPYKNWVLLLRHNDEFSLFCSPTLCCQQYKYSFAI